MNLNHTIDVPPKNRFQLDIGSEMGDGDSHNHFGGKKISGQIRRGGAKSKDYGGVQD